MSLLGSTQRPPDRDGACAAVRLSEAFPKSFAKFYDRFVRFWPRKSFHVKYGYVTGFVEKKTKSKAKPLPLFESLALEMAERHLDAASWRDWRGARDATPIWLAMHMPKKTTVDAIDFDAKDHRVGYYSFRDQPRPLIHLPLDHFKALKRLYDAFPDRIWCISSETLGMHIWRIHDRPRSSVILHGRNKERLAQIGLPSVESHPMPGRCFRRPFGADYRTITPDGILTRWQDQVEFVEHDRRTPKFEQICDALLSVMREQQRLWNESCAKCAVKEDHHHE